VAPQVFHGCFQGDTGRLTQGIAIDPRADSREGHAFQLPERCQFQAFGVGAPEQVCLSPAAAPIDRPHRVDDIPGLQFAGRGNYGLTGGTAADLPALVHNGRPAGPVDGPVHSGSPGQSGVGGVDDGLRFFLGNVSLNQGQGALVDLHFHTDHLPAIEIFTANKKPVHRR